MKTKLFLSVLSIIFLCSQAVAGTKKDAMWAHHYRYKYFGFLADHVYTCVNNSGDVETFAHWGDKNYETGDYLDGTWGYGDYGYVRCVADAWLLCKLIFGYDGICHQDANRHLYSSGKKVTKARGYWIFYPFYDHYGEKSKTGKWLWQACRYYCD